MMMITFVLQIPPDEFQMEVWSQLGPSQYIQPDRTKKHLMERLETECNFYGVYVAESNIPTVGLGLFAALDIPEGTEFPYFGKFFVKSKQNIESKLALNQLRKLLHPSAIDEPTIIKFQNPSSHNYMLGTLYSKMINRE